MKVIYEAYDGLKFEVEAGSLQDAIVEAVELHDSIGFEKCGKCGSDKVFPNHRQVDKFHYYELKCHAFIKEDGVTKRCGAVLELGTNQNSKKTLFKKRMVTDDDGAVVLDENKKGKWLPDNGWVRYNPVTKKKE